MNSKGPVNMVGILQPGYLPWLGFFEQVYRCDVFVIYDDVQFDKGGWRNRNRIKTPGGPQWLTVPVLTKGKKFPLIKDVQINGSIPWQKKHIKSIKQNYSKAPFFDDYGLELIRIIDRPWKYLLDLDMELIYWLLNVLGIKTEMVLSSELQVEGKRVDRLIGIIKKVGGRVFYEGAAGKSYINTDLFEQEGISVVFQDYKHPVYPQLYGDFVSHLSVIDLLFNCGPGSLDIIIKQAEV